MGYDATDKTFFRKVELMLRAWKLGKVAGIDVYLHWSVLLLPFFPVMARAYSGPTPENAPSLGMQMLLIVTLFFCVLLHEFGHSLMALFFGIRTADITLYPIGGVARLANTPRNADAGPLGTPWQEFWIALAGPAVNVAIVAAIILVDQVVDFQPGTFLQSYATLTAETNVALVLFNMMPFFPMDGGRVLRALLATGFGQLRATEIATVVGLPVALLFVCVAIAYSYPLLILITGVIYFLGQQEVAMLRYRAAQEQSGANWPVRQVTLDSSSLPPEEHFTGFTFDRQHRAWIAWKDGRPIHGCGLE